MNVETSERDPTKEKLENEKKNMRGKRGSGLEETRISTHKEPR